MCSDSHAAGRCHDVEGRNLKVIFGYEIKVFVSKAPFQPLGIRETKTKSKKENRKMVGKMVKQSTCEMINFMQILCQFNLRALPHQLKFPKSIGINLIAREKIAPDRNIPQNARHRRCSKIICQ